MHFDFKYKLTGGIFASLFVFCAAASVASICLIIYILYRVAVFLS